MTYKVETFTVGQFTVDIFQDEDAPNPRTDYDHAGTMACFHGRYNLGDPIHDYSADDFDGWREMGAQMVKDGARVILPLYLYDHSGISIRAGHDFRDADPGGWDSGQVGFIFATADQIREWWMVKRITKEVESNVRECLIAEVEEYDQYLRGDVYGYVVEDAAGEQLDSCWGFFGLANCMSEAKLSAEHYEAHRGGRLAPEHVA